MSKYRPMELAERLRGGQRIFSDDLAIEMAEHLDTAAAFQQEREEFREYQHRLKQLLKPDAVEAALSAIELAQVRQKQVCASQLRGDRLAAALNEQGKNPASPEQIHAPSRAAELSHIVLYLCCLNVGEQSEIHFELAAIARIHSLLVGMGYAGSTEKMVDQLIADAVARKAERDNLTKELAEAETRLDLLDALEAAGVDNWSGYSEAMKTLGNDDDK